MCACVCDQEAEGEKRIAVSPESELQSFRNRNIATLVKGFDRVATMAPLQVSISSTICVILCRLFMILVSQDNVVYNNYSYYCFRVLTV